MRIALIKRRYSLKVGGSERYCVMLARHLRAAGHDVAVIGESIDEELSGEVTFLPVAVNRLTSWFRNRSFAENAGKLAQAGRFDIAYGLGRSFGLDCVRVTERLQAHWLDVYYRNPLSRLLQGLNPRHRTLIDLEKTIYHSPDVRRIITQSRLDRKLLVEQYNVPESKIRTIYNGVDTTAFNPDMRKLGPFVRREMGIPPEVPLLVFASMDFEGKGLRSILKALASTRHRTARLLVLGNGPEAKFKRIAHSLGVEQRTIFAGRRADISRYYGAGDLFLLPTAYEPFPNVNLEAMACGLPVMTTSTAGGADIIRQNENGYLISDVHAVEEMIACLDRHCGLSPDDRQRMSDACWSTAKELPIERNIQQTLAMFEEVVREKRAA